jgi:glycerol-3-phosphate acyltransferase PlsY
MLEFLNYCRYLVIPLGYFIGSISGAYIICRLIGKFDIRIERDGRISAAEVYRKLGTRPFLYVVGIDVVKGLVSVTIAQLITQNMSCSLIIVLLTGFLTVIGHNWSIFLQFKGGLGATVMYGVLGGILFFQTLIALI